MPGSDTSTKPHTSRRLAKWIAAGFLAAIATLLIIAAVLARRAAPTLKTCITETLRASFHGRVDLENLDISGWRGFEVTGDHLRIYQAADAQQPLVALRHFEFHAPLIGLLFQPMHVSEVKIDGLEINIPPPTARPAVTTSSLAEKSGGHMDIVVDELVCDNSQLIIGNANPDKGPKTFVLRHIELHNVSRREPWRYQASLTNPIPRGEIQASGSFGPWQPDSPADTAVTGNYKFQHADLGTIKGIGGILSSTGQFQGKLDRIEIEGTTDTPDFSVDTANLPSPLHTRFHAIVDGITGDTYLQPVEATLRGSHFTTSGAVTDVKGMGHTIDLDVDVPAGRLQDFLDLVVATKPPVLTASIGAKAKLHIRAGKERVVEKLSIQGRFTLRGMHFTNPEVQDKVDMLSLRAQGEPEKAKPGAEDVSQVMRGTFSLQDGSIRFNNLVYTLPGVQVDLAGMYSLDGQVFDFRGHVLTQAPLSKMVQSRWASLALKAISPFFHGPHGGADIPVRISGTRAAPKFGLDFAAFHGR
jgi:hypothetical protein